MSNCNNILSPLKLTPEEVAGLRKELGKNIDTPELVEKIIDIVRAKKFRVDSNDVSEKLTSDAMNKLNDVLLNVKKPYKKLFNMLVGEKSGITSKALARTHARFGYFASKLRMGNKDIKKLFYNKKFVENFLKEMENLDSNKAKTGSKLAWELAKVVTDYQKRQVKELNKFGGGVYWRDDFITKQWHDPYRMLKADKTGKKWVDDIYDALNHEETERRIREVMEERGQTIKGGFDLKYYLGRAFKEMTSESSNKGMILDNLHHRRVFKFRDTESFINYNKLYGHENLLLATLENMTMMDNHIAFGEAFGFGYRQKVKPDKVTEQKALKELESAKRTKDSDLIQEAQQNYDNLFWKNVDPANEMKKGIYLLKEQGKISKGQYRRLLGALAQVTGDAYLTSSPLIAKMVTGFQFWEYLTKLGKATISSINDLWTGAVILHYQGIKPGRAYLGLMNHIFKNAFKRITEGEKNKLLRQLNVGIDGIFESYSRNYINNPTMGTLSKLTDKMFDLNLLNWWTNSAREGVGKMMSMHFADMLTHNFDDLPKLFKNLMNDYELSAKDWNILKAVGSFDETAFNTAGSKKNKFVTSDYFIEEVAKRDKDGNIIGIKDNYKKMGLSLDDAKRIESSINRYYIMESRLAVPEAGAAERAWMYGDSQRGSLPDTTARLFFQFRTHQVKLIRNLIPRMHDMGISSLMHVVPAIGFGYVSSSLKRMLSGKQPLPFDDPRTAQEALVQSGVAGFLADYLGGQYGRYQHDWDEAILGSAYKSIKSHTQLGYELVRGNKDAIDIYKHLRHQVPFANLFWTEAAVNYGLHWGIMETANPGYLKRLEARERGRGSGFLVNPSSIWDYGGLR